MASKSQTSRKLEIRIDAVEDSRGGYFPLISIGDVKLNLNANTYETVEQALDSGASHFAMFIEMSLRQAISNSYL